MVSTSAQSERAFFEWNPSVDPARATVRGVWTLAYYTELELLRASYPEISSTPSAGTVQIDFVGLDALDTAGALCLYALLGEQLLAALDDPAVTLSAERRKLLQTVVAAQGDMPSGKSAQKPLFIIEWLGRIGGAVNDIWRQTVLLLGFMGITLEALARNVVRPRQWRITSIVAQVEATGLDAVPIVALLTFMVGAVVAFLGATILADFGASIYTVNLVGFSFLREFAVLLTAILMAGRTASSFTAQLGSMKANEEIDALRMTGLDPVDLLVLPRILAMLISLPILTFVGMVSGIFGGMVVCALALDISPLMFMTVFKQDIEVRHFFLGMVKAPIFAYLIAIIGCLEGFKVQGSAQSVGEHTTSAVVQSIFLVILIDAVAALFFMEMGW